MTIYEGILFFKKLLGRGVLLSFRIATEHPVMNNSYFPNGEIHNALNLGCMELGSFLDPLRTKSISVTLSFHAFLLIFRLFVCV